MWLAAQSAGCKTRNVGVVSLFLEDFGGHVREGPASPLWARQVHDLERACDVLRARHCCASSQAQTSGAQSGGFPRTFRR